MRSVSMLHFFLYLDQSLCADTDAIAARGPAPTEPGSGQSFAYPCTQEPCLQSPAVWTQKLIGTAPKSGLV